MRTLVLLATALVFAAANISVYAEDKPAGNDEATLEKAVRERPNDPDAIGELGLLRLRQDNLAQAYELFSRAVRLTGGRNDEWRSLEKTARFWLLLREARNARGTGDLGLAERKVNEAIRLDSKVPDSYAILGGIQADRGQAATAKASYRRALSLNAVNREALEGLIALYRRQGMTQARYFIKQLTPAQRKAAANAIANLEYSSVETQASDPDEFLPALTIIPAERRPANISRLWGESLQKRIDADVTAGRREQAVQLLQQAGALAVNDEVASLAVAVSWGTLGEYRQADALFRKLRADPPSLPWRLQHARYLANRHSPELGAELDAIAAMPTLSPEDQQALLGLQESLAKEQLESGHPDLALRTLSPLVKSHPGNTSLLLLEARAYYAEKKWALAQSTYEHILQLTPGDGEASSGLIETKIAVGDRTGALSLLDEWAAAGFSGNPYSGLKMIGLYLELGDDQRAHQVLTALLEQYPNQPDVLFSAAQMAHRDGRLDDEKIYLQRSVAADRARRSRAAGQTAEAEAGGAVPYQQVGFDDLNSADKIHRDWKESRLAALIDSRTDWLSSSVDVHSRSGTPGMFQYHALEIPVEYRTPWHMNDDVFFRADWVSLNAGTVDPASTLFGTMQLCQPNCKAAPLDQTAQGMSFDTGYHREGFSADIGVTPTNFLVSNVVGGILQQGNTGWFGYSLEASRRPVTDSVHSFAGSRDPNTGAIWGGVVATGGRLGLSLDSGRTFGFWSSFGWHNLTGMNVQSNQRTQIMAGEQFRVINEDNRKFILGVTAMYWRFAQDAGEYTFGQGGYYSPHYFRSFALPVTYMERYTRFSYMLQGSVSIARAEMTNAPYYPTDGALQLAAGNPMYFGSSTTVRGHSMAAIGEYQVGRKLFAGGLLSIDRSQNYSPNQAMVYLRYSLDQPASQPVFMPPLPVAPSSQFK